MEELYVVSVTLCIPECLLKRAQETTGQRDAASAIRRAVELATGSLKLKTAARRALGQSRREEREGKVRRFRSAKDALAHLKRV